MQLIKTIFPKCETENRGLYYRAEGPVQLQSGALSLQAGASIRLDTYFNAFFYSKYVQHTQAERVTVSACFSGRFEAKLICVAPDMNETVLETTELYGENAKTVFAPILLKDLPEGGMLFCAFTALEESAVFSVSYEAEIPQPNDVCVACVICTYRREGYVRANLLRIEQAIWQNGDSSIAQDLDVFVIDNGQTLPPQSSGHLRILPNKNGGGSAGFARGMLEALHCSERYTHVLLMDDDISFEPAVLERTVQLLKVANQGQRPLCIGGQMLIEDEPTMQFEAGSCYVDGRLCPIGRGMELSGLRALLENEQKHTLDYNAWWYCCIPLSLIRARGLPLPLFIKTDDVEYGLRSGADFLVMNGIGVWHKAFAEKQSVHLEYYIKRNELIVSAMHHRGDGVVASLHKLFCSMGGSILKERTDAIAFIRKGYKDFLKGPDFLLQTDAEQLNAELLGRRKRKGPTTILALLWSAAIMLEMLIRFPLRYRSVQRAYIERQGELTSVSFWSGQLELQKG